MNRNILLCGVGGQGTVLASKLLAAAAMDENIPVMSAETIGMAQKGGSVFSYMRMGENIHAPMFSRGQADLIIAFEPAEAVRMLPYLKEGGSVVVNSGAIMPVTATLSGSNYAGQQMIDYLAGKVEHLTVIDGLAAAEKLGSPKVLNMVLLGAALASGSLPISMETVKKVMKERVKPQFFDLNCAALSYFESEGKEI